MAIGRAYGMRNTFRKRKEETLPTTGLQVDGEHPDGASGLRAIGAIHALEKALRRPVLTANQVLLWQALGLVGVASKVTQYGRVFTRQPAR